MKLAHGLLGRSGLEWAGAGLTQGGTRTAARRAEADRDGRAQGPLITDAEIAALRAHPRFGEAARACAAGWVQGWQGRRLANLVASDRGRFFIGAMALHLHFEAETGGPPLTAAALKALAQREGVASAGRTAALIALMQWAGFLTAETTDAGVRRFVPTERLVALNRERWAAMLSGLALLFPEARTLRDRLSEPSVARAFARAQGEGFLSGFRALAHAPEVTIFAERNAGLVILCSLLLAEPGARRPLSLTGLARRFHVSRPHVTRLFQDAERLGLFTSGEASAGAAILAPALRDALERFVAALFLLNLGCVRRALHDVTAAPPAAS